MIIKGHNYPRDMLTTLDHLSYQTHRLTCLGDAQITENIMEKSLDLLTAIMNYYTQCLVANRNGLLGKK